MTRVLALLLLASAASAQESDPDPWFGRDKALHFGASFGLAAGGYGVSSLWLETPGQRALAGGAVALSFGIGKELLDLAGLWGQPSWKDLAWDVVGAGAGLLVSYAIDRLIAWLVGSIPDAKLRAGVPKAGRSVFEDGLVQPFDLNLQPRDLGGQSSNLFLDR